MNFLYNILSRKEFYFTITDNILNDIRLYFGKHSYGTPLKFIIFGQSDSQSVLCFVQRFAEKSPLFEAPIITF